MPLQNASPEQAPKKRRQHHVWQKYLNAWCANGQLYCLSNNRIFATGTAAVGVENYFYKVGKLTLEDVELVRFLAIDVEGVHALTKKLHEGFLALVASPQLFEGRSQDLDDLIDTYRTNALEDYHMGIERSFLPLLERMLHDDISFLSNDQSCITLFHFLATQHMRTKGIRTKTVEVLKEKNNLDVSRIWAILSHMYASNIGMNVFLERKKRTLALIENTTGNDFITGDQPLINLHGDGNTPPTMLTWYYPISPRRALLLTEVNEEPAFSSGGLTAGQVHDLNARMFSACHRQTFAREEPSLVPFAT